jgi:type VI protein secretion system component VasF
VPEEWGNSPFDRLRRELLDALEKQTARLETKLDAEIKELKDGKAAKWVETAMGACIGTVCITALGQVLALIYLGSRAAVP